jgi:formate hydrogenlyase transcriptional activator
MRPLAMYENEAQDHEDRAFPPAATERNRDHLAMVLEVSRAAAALELPELIERVGSCMRQTRPNWEFTSLSLYDQSANALRQYHLFAAPQGTPTEANREEGALLIPIDGTQSGCAFSSGEPHVVNSRAEYEAMVSPAWGARILSLIPPEFSSCAVPLICRGRRLGALAASTSRNGACDANTVELLVKIAAAIAPAVDNALAYREIKELKERLSKEKTYLESEIRADLGEIVGESQALRQVLRLVDSVAGTDSTVLIQGETGTGKELIARAIHQRSACRDRTFVKLNCAAIPGGLLESELFGHEKGAFTGAVAQRIGRFELGHGGTLFLDEVGEIPLELQSKLLRVLQEQAFERVGGTRTIKVAVRVIAATNRDLVSMVAERSFRSDLYYRLNVFPIAVPPLRERREDIPLLVRHIVDRSARRLKKTITEVAAETLEAIAQYDWPGNVRELENVIERSVILSPGPELNLPPAALAGWVGVGGRPTAARKTSTSPATATQTLAQAERAFIVRALDQTSWVVGGPSGAGALLGLSRTTLQARMRKLAITRPR